MTKEKVKKGKIKIRRLKIQYFFCNLFWNDPGVFIVKKLIKKLIFW